MRELKLRINQNRLLTAIDHHNINNWIDYFGILCVRVIVIVNLGRLTVVPSLRMQDMLEFDNNIHFVVAVVVLIVHSFYVCQEIGRR